MARLTEAQQVAMKHVARRLPRRVRGRLRSTIATANKLGQFMLDLIDASTREPTNENPRPGAEATTVEISYQGVAYRIQGKTTDPITKKINSERTFYELPVLERLEILFKKSDREGALIVDAGANIGNHAVFLASRFPRATVLAFEMNPESFDYLTKNIKSNDLVNVVPLNLGLSDRGGRSGLRLEASNPLGGAQLDFDASEQSVQLTTLDGYLAANGKTPSVALVKIDVEGHELQCLSGARKTLKRDRPLVIVECKEAEEYTSICKLFASLNYDVLEAAPGAMPNLVFAPREFISAAFTEDELAASRADLCARHVDSWELRRRIRHLRTRLETR